MIAKLLNQLIQPKPQPLSETDARLALGAILVRVARSDNVYTVDEQRNIDAILTARYGLAPADVTALRQDAETLEAQAPDTVRFTRAIKDAVDHEHRLAVVESLWTVAFADGVRTHEEDAVIRLVANLLGITDQESARARQKVTPD